MRKRISSTIITAFSLASASSRIEESSTEIKEQQYITRLLNDMTIDDTKRSLFTEERDSDPILNLSDTYIIPEGPTQTFLEDSQYPLSSQDLLLLNEYYSEVGAEGYAKYDLEGRKIGTIKKRPVSHRSTPYARTHRQGTLETRMSDEYKNFLKPIFLRKCEEKGLFDIPEIKSGYEKSIRTYNEKNSNSFPVEDFTTPLPFIIPVEAVRYYLGLLRSCKSDGFDLQTLQSFIQLNSGPLSPTCDTNPNECMQLEIYAVSSLITPLLSRDQLSSLSRTADDLRVDETAYDFQFRLAMAKCYFTGDFDPHSNLHALMVNASIILASSEARSLILGYARSFYDTRRTDKDKALRYLKSTLTVLFSHMLAQSIEKIMRSLRDIEHRDYMQHTVYACLLCDRLKRLRRDLFELFKTLVPYLGTELTIERMRVLRSNIISNFMNFVGENTDGSPRVRTAMSELLAMWQRKIDSKDVSGSTVTGFKVHCYVNVLTRLYRGICAIFVLFTMKRSTWTDLLELNSALEMLALQGLNVEKLVMFYEEVRRRAVMISE